MKKIIIGIAAVGLFSSCNQVENSSGSDKDSSKATINTENSYKANIIRDESITKENAYSDLFLDSIALENYIRKENLASDKAQSMRSFYLVRANQFAWFTTGGITEQARGLWSLYASRKEKIKNEPGFRIEQRMDSLMVLDSVSFSVGDTTLIQTELALTSQYVQLASENKGVITAENFYWLVPRKKMDAVQLADSLLKQNDSSLGNNNSHYALLKNSLQLYYTAAKNRGWDSVSAKGLKKGSQSPQVILLKKRLAVTKDYPANDTSNIFTDSLAIAVKNIQQQFGLPVTGQPDDSLIAELNVPATERLQQVLVNMNRALWMPAQNDSSRIVINIPSQQLVIYEGNKNLMQMPVIVGKEGTGTMSFADEITKIVFNPYWNIPQSIVQNEIKPAMEKDKNYLEKKNMEIVRQHDSLPEIRQLPGKDNALGRVKFLFPNTFDIYLHDTPHKGLFTQKNRALSHGCIRVAKPDSLAFYILRGQNEWTLEKIKAAMNSNKEQTVSVKNPVPVVISYFTSWIDENGRLSFRKDLYGYDKKTSARMFTNLSLPFSQQA
jgi:murein L,D-transpeptidase YcbB/YkuD